MKNGKKQFILGLLIIGMAANSRGQSSASQKNVSAAVLKGGVSEVNITPPVGCRLAGHFYESLSTGVHDSLWAKAMVLQQGNEKFVFVFCDLVGITQDISAKARSTASAKTGVPIENILIAATHSHTGPLFYGFQHQYFHGKAVAEKGYDPQEKINYSQFLTGQIVKSIVQADHATIPVRIEIGIAKQTGLSFNRRYYMKSGKVLFNPGPLNPDIVGPAGPVDPDVDILLFRNAKSGAYTGGLTVFAMHADCTGGSKISADYPYYLEQTLKNKLGKNYISAFAEGTSGDINHINVKKDEPIYSTSNPQRIGSTLAKTVINEIPELGEIRDPSFQLASAHILLPLQVPDKAQIDSAKLLIQQLYEAKGTGEYVKRAGGEAGDFLKRVEMSKYISLEGKGPDVKVEVQVFRIDSETAIVGLPGEPFAEFGLAIKRRSPFKNTIVMGICNDKTSYIPTIKAFKEGSYEVTNAIVKPGAGEMLVEAAVGLLNSLK